MAARTIREGVPTDLIKIVDRLQRKAAPAMRQALQKALRESRGEFAALLRKLPPAQAAEVLSLWENLQAGLIGLYGENGPLVGAMMTAGERTVETVAATWSKVEAGFQNRSAMWLQAHGARRVTAVSKDTRAAIRQVIEDAASGPLNIRSTARRLLELPALGLDVPQMRAFEKEMASYVAQAEAQEITASQLQFALDRRYESRMLYRAKRIAITEASNAGNAAVDLALRESVAAGQLDPEEIELEWVTRVVNACPVCQAMDGQRRSITGGLFVSNVVEEGTYAGQRVSFERPTAHPFCYCGVRTVRRGEKSGLYPRVVLLRAA